jgi:hypothetical protein
MKLSLLFALMALTALCIPAHAQSGNLEVFPQAVEMNFPQGYAVYSGDGEVLKTVPGPTSAAIRARSSGKSFASGEVYLSDWSFDRMQEGERPNWIVPKLQPAAITLSKKDSRDDLVVYPIPRTKVFSLGYDAYDDNGQLSSFEGYPGPKTLMVIGATELTPFGRGPAYFSEWAEDADSAGKKPRSWIIPRRPYAGVRNVLFPHGYSVISPAGEPLEKIAGPASLRIAAEMPIDFNGGTVYLTEHDLAALNSDEPVRWIRAEGRPPSQKEYPDKINRKDIRTIVQEYPRNVESIAVTRNRQNLAAMSSGLIYLYDIPSGLLKQKFNTGIPGAVRIFYDDDDQNLLIVADSDRIDRLIPFSFSAPHHGKTTLYAFDIRNHILTLKGEISAEDLELLACKDKAPAKSAFASIANYSIFEDGSMRWDTWAERVVDLGKGEYAFLPYQSGNDDSYLSSGEAILVTQKSDGRMTSTLHESASVEALRALKIPEHLVRNEFERQQALANGWGLQNFDRASGLINESIFRCPYVGCFFDARLRGFVVGKENIYHFEPSTCVKQIDGISVNENGSTILMWGTAFQDVDCYGWYDFYVAKADRERVAMPTVMSFSELTASELPTGENIVWNGALSPDGYQVAAVLSEFESLFRRHSEGSREEYNLANKRNPKVQIYQLGESAAEMVFERHGVGDPVVTAYRGNKHINAINASRATRIGFESDKPADSIYKYIYSKRTRNVDVHPLSEFNSSDINNIFYNYRDKSRNGQLGIECQWFLTGKGGNQQTSIQVTDLANGHVRYIATGDVCSHVFPIAENTVLIADATGMYTLNIETGEQLASWDNPYTGLNRQVVRPAKSLAVSAAAQRLFYLSDDASIHILDFEREGKLSYVCRLSLMESGAPVIMLPDSSYLALRPMRGGIHFSDGDAVYPLEQFDLRLNRPDIVLERLGAPTVAVAIAKQLREKRLKRMGVTKDMLKPDFHVPGLEIVGDVPTATDANAISLAIKASDSKYPLERLKVYVNNVPVNGRDGESLRDQNTQALERTIPVKLAAGRNKIQVSVLNSAGAESLYANAEVNCAAKRPKPALYAVALGVSDYSNPEWNLKYAAKDAKDVVERIKAKSSASYSEVKELLLTDKQVTKESLGQIRDFLKDATIDDTVLMFVAGHGLLDSKYDYYFGTTDIDFNNPAEKGIAFEEFDDLLAGLPSLKKSLLIDTCHAGELDEEEKTLLASAGGTAAPLPAGNGIAMRSIGTRGMNVKAIEGARGASEWYDRLQGLFVDLRRGSGSTILSSSAGAEYALESSEQQNGLFTYAVLEALDGTKDADTNKDGSVQMSELGEYVKKRVSELTNNKQTPNTRRVNLEGDFTLAKTE